MNECENILCIILKTLYTIINKYGVADYWKPINIASNSNHNIIPHLSINFIC